LHDYGHEGDGCAVFDDGGLLDSAQSINAYALFVLVGFDDGGRGNDDRGAAGIVPVTG
jgi:hypothetical protein